MAKPADDILLKSVTDGVMTITLNRPASLNGLTITLVSRINAALREAEARPDVRVVVLTGAGRAFCAGGDIKEFDAFDYDDPVALQFKDDPQWMSNDTLATRTVHASDGPILLHKMGKPTIASVRGACAGAGVSYASACDFRIVSDTAIFTTAFAKIGLSGELGSSYFLTKLVGPAKARELFFFAERVDAQEALRIGLVNKVVKDAELEAETMAFAKRLADGPPIAYRYIKANLTAAETQRVEDLMEIEAAHQVRALRSEDSKEAVAAFFEKRAAKFSGR